MLNWVSGICTRWKSIIERKHCHFRNVEVHSSMVIMASLQFLAVLHEGRRGDLRR